MRSTMEILETAAKQRADVITEKQKNDTLNAMADALEAQIPHILAENALDMRDATSISAVMRDRLALNETRIRAMADGVRAVAQLPDPVGRVLRSIERSNGLKIEKVAVPLGVVAIIYESRPNVTSDAAALALKSGNVCI